MDAEEIHESLSRGVKLNCTGGEYSKHTIGHGAEHEKPLLKNTKIKPLMNMNGTYE